MSRRVRTAGLLKASEIAKMTIHLSSEPEKHPQRVRDWLKSKLVVPTNSFNAQGSYAEYDAYSAAQVALATQMFDLGTPFKAVRQVIIEINLLIAFNSDRQGSKPKSMFEKDFLAIWKVASSDKPDLRKHYTWHRLNKDEVAQFITQKTRNGLAIFTLEHGRNIQNDSSYRGPE